MNKVGNRQQMNFEGSSWNCSVKATGDCFHDSINFDLKYLEFCLNLVTVSKSVTISSSFVLLTPHDY